jgi:hypothetical protein
MSPRPMSSPLLPLVFFSQCCRRPYPALKSGWNLIYSNHNCILWIVVALTIASWIKQLTNLRFRLRGPEWRCLSFQFPHVCSFF